MTNLLRRIRDVIFIGCALCSLALALYAFLHGIAPYPEIGPISQFFVYKDAGIASTLIWWLTAIAFYGTSWAAGQANNIRLRISTMYIAWLLLAGFVAVQLAILAEFDGRL